MRLLHACPPSCKRLRIDTETAGTAERRLRALELVDEMVAKGMRRGAGRAVSATLTPDHLLVPQEVAGQFPKNSSGLRLQFGIGLECATSGIMWRGF